MHSPADLPPDLVRRRDLLLEILRSLGKCAVAFSGGIDSTVVARAAHEALGDRAVAVTADSPSVARAELADAKRLAALIGIRHEIVETNEFANPRYLENDGSRCFHCKDELYSQIETLLPRPHVRLAQARLLQRVTHAVLRRRRQAGAVVAGVIDVGPAADDLHAQARE